MGRRHKTARGNFLDMDQLVQTNQHRVAVGNMSVNAKGDLIGKSGKIVKTREEVVREYYFQESSETKTISLKDDPKKPIPTDQMDEVFITPKEFLEAQEPEPKSKKGKKST